MWGFKGSPNCRKSSCTSERKGSFVTEGGTKTQVGKEKGSSRSNVRMWMKNYQYPGRHLPNICFPVCWGTWQSKTSNLPRTCQGVFLFWFMNLQRHQDSGFFLGQWIPSPISQGQETKYLGWTSQLPLPQFLVHLLPSPLACVTGTPSGRCRERREGRHSAMRFWHQPARQHFQIKTFSKRRKKAFYPLFFYSLLNRSVGLKFNHEFTGRR